MEARLDMVVVVVVVFFLSLALPVESSDIVLPWNDDVLGLIVFKADLHDPRRALASWSEDSASPCNWTGIQCSPQSGRVTQVTLDGLELSGPLGRGLLKLDHLQVLSLARNNLSGSISPQIRVLKSLRNLSLSHNALSGPLPGASLASLELLSLLDVSQNSFSGSVPPELFANCSKSLRYVFLSGNQLEGDLPDSIASCESLEALGASENRLSGSIPAGVGSLSRLSSLDLSHNSLSGEIPPELGQCQMLVSLDLSYNLLSGEIPSFLESLSRLEVLRLPGNSFSGGVPEWIVTGFPELQELNLAENDLGGTLPSSIGSMKALRRLYLHNNNLQGALPPTLGGCFNLSTIDLSSNNFSGAIPDEIFELELESLALAMNSFSGGLPAALSSSNSSSACKVIQSLDLSRNSLEGEIPPQVSGCQHLRSLNLGQNGLSGNIPEELVAGLSELSSLDLGSNFLTGYIPRSFGGSPSLETLKLDDNALVGIIPEELGNCSSLRYLDLSQNNLTGGIPVELADLSSLQSLDLSSNHLTGQIPTSFAQLQNLSLFNVSHNSLAGPIPSDGAFPLLDPSSFAGNAHLCGASLSIACPAIPKPIVLNPNATTTPDPIISSSDHRSPPSSKIVLSVSAIIAISAAAVIALGIVVVSLLNLRSHPRPRASFYVVDSLPGSSPSEDLAIGKLVMFTDDSDSRDEDLLPTAQALLNKNSEIGRGGFGTVYKATLAAGRTVAVKKLSVPGMVETQDEFEKRVQFLGKIQHENLVNFQGYYFTPKLQLLIYDFVPNGNLHSKLHEQSVLPWELRFKVALGAAQGLCYLHHKCRPRVIHYNFKSSNVLLDDGFNARVSDYGLAKLLHSRDRFVVMNKLQSSLGYLAPECGCESFKVTEKCDVYGFGVVLLELITGKPPVEYLENDVVILCDFVRSLADDGKPLLCVDPKMVVYPEEEVMTLIKLGLVCTSPVPANRPSMTEVVQILELIKPLADNRS
ncbi:probable LRR receptor-like serine/threonine-protein kinase IRK [Selaginella moellendorffii]|uniref:probable LRR receptor-like serine/threonine-protein kinase IRK n=1 Tax=Selaginella moellendorffii TaxID=88036 RepID=UPI000D1C9377|nr:probable LRR receptor-like serine/threonine-protein kinase IRK [Selaginella moellendorffii]|eukprot:XP_024516304.1 probable LRR receptor-like serine/threonine-protein kinase IRK [Selaginella moellendorffii]